MYDVAAHLLECACARFGAECPARRCVVAGTQVSYENCCAGPTGGQLTVHVTRLYPSRSFPDPDFRRPANCDAPYTVVQYEVTVLRCAHVGSGTQAPTCQQLDGDAQLTLRDAEWVRDSVSCCLLDKEAVTLLTRGPYAWALGDQLTLGPEGACVGSKLTVLVGLPTCLEC